MGKRMNTGSSQALAGDLPSVDCTICELFMGSAIHNTMITVVPVCYSFCVAAKQHQLKRYGQLEHPEIWVHTLLPDLK